MSKMLRGVALVLMLSTMSLPAAVGAKTMTQDEAAMAQQKQAELNKAYAEKQADEQRYRARELQNKIYWWKQQLGQSQYDDASVNANINSLQYELNGIPPAFWP